MFVYQDFPKVLTLEYPIKYHNYINICQAMYGRLRKAGGCFYWANDKSALVDIRTGESLKPMTECSSLSNVNIHFKAFARYCRLVGVILFSESNLGQRVGQMFVSFCKFKDKAIDPMQIVKGLNVVSMIHKL